MLALYVTYLKFLIAFSGEQIQVPSQIFIDDTNDLEHCTFPNVYKCVVSIKE